MPRLIKSDNDQLSLRRKALYVAHRHVNFYLNTLSFLRLVEFETIGKPSTTTGFIVANHPSLLDFIIFLRDFPHAICLYKPESLKNPVLSSFIQTAGYIKGMNGEKSESTRIIEQCGHRFKQGHHIAVFPEGTRSPSAKTIHKFRTLIFHAAIKNDAPIQPVAIYCKPLFLGKNQRWSEFSKGINKVTLQYLPEIYVSDLPENEQSAVGLAKAVEMIILNALENMP